MKIKISSIDKFKQKYDKIFDIAQTNNLDGKMSIITTMNLENVES